MGKDGYDVEYIPNGVPDASLVPIGGETVERIRILEGLRESASPPRHVVAREARQNESISPVGAQRLRGRVKLPDWRRTPA